MRSEQSVHGVDGTTRMACFPVLVVGLGKWDATRRRLTSLLSSRKSNVRGDDLLVVRRCVRVFACLLASAWLEWFVRIVRVEVCVVGLSLGTTPPPLLFAAVVQQ